MSNFYRPEQLLARIWAEINAIKARLRNIDESGSIRNPGGGGGPAPPVGGVQVHTHGGVGQGGQIDADPVTFAPGAVTDWNASADPGDVDDALDQLADRTKILEGGAGHAALTLGADFEAIATVTSQVLSLDNETANTVFAGPATGVPADPTFRALVDADIPAAIARDSEVTTAVSDHAAAADPHTAYQKESEKDAANGYAGLTAGTKLNLAQMQEVIAYADLTDDPIGTHLADAVDAHDASAVSNVPAGSVVATTVQAAIDELATDYAAADSSHAGAADPHTGYMTPTEHTAIGGGSPHMAAPTIFVAASNATAAEIAAADPAYRCDGTADNVQINAALQLGPVVLSSGTFNIVATVTPLDNASLVGQGAATILHADVTGADALNIIAATGKTNVEIAHFQVEGNHDPAATATPETGATRPQQGSEFNQNGILLDTCTRSWVHHVYAQNNPFSGIILVGCRWCVIEDNIAADNGQNGIYLCWWNNQYNTVANNVCTGNVHYHGIGISGSPYNTIVGNVCQGNGRNRATANYFAGGGIILDGDSDGCTVTGNICVGNAWEGIGLYANFPGDGRGPQYCTVSGNTCTLNRHEGIRIRGSANNLVTGNGVLNNSQELNDWYDGVRIESVTPVATLFASSGNIVSNNRIGIYHKNGIHILDSDASGCLIGFNDLSGNVTNAVLLDGGATAAFVHNTGYAGNSSEHQFFTPVSVQTLAAGDAITVVDGSPDRLIDSTAARTLTSEPTIAAGRNGQVVYLHNVGLYSITLQDVNALGGSLLRLTANTLAINPGGTMGLLYDSTLGFWCQISLVNPQTFTPSIATFTVDGLAARNHEIGGINSLEDTSPANHTAFALTYVGTPSACVIDIDGGEINPSDYPVTVLTPFLSLLTQPNWYRGTTVVGSQRIFTATATVAGQAGKTKTVIITYINRRYMGPNAQATQLSSAQILALDGAGGTSDLSTIRTGSFAVTIGATEYCWYAYRSALGAALYFAIAGEWAGFNDLLTMSHTNDSGFAETFQQYRSINQNLGAVTVVAQTAQPNNRLYIGPHTATAITGPQILTLDDTADGESVVDSTIAGTYTAIRTPAGSGKYLWVCHPDRIADIVSIKDDSTGFGIGGAYVGTVVSHTNQWGAVEDYRTWRSTFAEVLDHAPNVTIT